MIEAGRDCALTACASSKPSSRPNLGTVNIPINTEINSYVPQFRYALQDLSPRSDAEIKGDVLTRLVRLAMRWIFPCAGSSVTNRWSI